MIEQNNSLEAAAQEMKVMKLSDNELEKAKEIARGIQIDNTQVILQYGYNTQKSISSFADTMLMEIRSKDAGTVGETLSELLMKIKDVNVSSLSAEKGFFQRLFSSIERFFAKYQKISTQMEMIIKQLNDSKMYLLRDITVLDQMYTKNLEYLKELDIYIEAGRIKLEELNTVDLPNLETKARMSNDPIDAQHLNDFKQFITQFEKKLHDLSLSRMIAIQTAPQIRIIQHNNRVLAEKIQSSIITTIPLWKNQIVIAVSLLRQKKALEVQKNVSDSTNDLLRKNSQMLNETSIEVAREMERGVVEIETLKQVNDNLIKTLEETIQIQQEGKQKRFQAEIELSKMETDLKQKLISMKDQRNNF